MTKLQKLFYVVIFIAVIILISYLGSTSTYLQFKTIDKLQKDIIVNNRDNSLKTSRHVVETSLVDKRKPFVFDISPGSCTPSDYFLIIVCAAWTDGERRNAIRQSWGQWTRATTAASSGNQIPSNKYTAKLVFLFAANSKTNVFGKMREEQSIYHDILYTPSFVDHYRNLTLKSLAALNWASKKCPGVRYMFKADGDVFINVPRLFEYVLSNYPVAAKNKGNALGIIGNLQHNAIPSRDNNSKWFVTYEEFNKKYYPDYSTGPGYLVSGAAIPRLAKYGNAALASGKPIMVWEDVCVTGIWREALNLPLAHSNHFEYESWDSNRVANSNGLCDYLATVLMSHRVSSNEMRTIWAKMELEKCKSALKGVLAAVSKIY